MREGFDRIVLEYSTLFAPCTTFDLVTFNALLSAMAATHRQEEDLKRKCKDAAAKTTDPIEKLRLSCLARGASGIKGIGRY